EAGGVGDLDGFVDVLCSIYRGDRAEHFLGVQRHVLGDVGDHRRRVEPAGPVKTLTAAADHCAGRGGLVDLVLDLIAARLGGQRTDVGVRVGRVADAQRLHPLDELVDERVINVSV